MAETITNTMNSSGDPAKNTFAHLILANLRAENKLLRRQTLNGILEELKSVEENFEKQCAIAVRSPTHKVAIKLDSDDEEEEAEQPESVGVDGLQQSDSILANYGGVQNLLKSLVLSLADPVEKCRELAYESVSILVEKSGKKTVTTMLPLIIPTVVERLAQQELIESSEEVRLIAVAFLSQLLRKSEKELIPFVDDLIAILLQTLVDPYHEVRIESSKFLSLLARTMPEVFHYNSEHLVKPLCSSLSHQQSRVRKAVAECIGDVLQYGSHKPAENYVPHLTQRLFDPNPGVRKCVVSVVGNWMLNFSDRYSHFHRFLPILLTGLCDESPDVSGMASQLWAKVGEKYLEENIQDVKDLVDFPADEPSHYPHGVTRPIFGCRMLAHREVCKLIPGVTHDIMDWQDENRQKSAQLLYHLILNCEEKMTMHVEPIFVCMFRACLDSNSTVISYVLQAATLLGYFVPMSTCWPLLAENLNANPSEGCLAVTCAYLKGVCPSHLPRFLNEVVELIVGPDVCQTLHAGKLNWILKICESVLALVPEAVAEQCPDILFRIILVVVSMSRDSDVIKRGQEAMDILRQVCGLQTIDNLFALYSGQLLEEIRDAEAEWTMSTPERLIFTAILTQAGSGIENNLEVVLDILVSYLGPNRDPEVRLSLFTELAGILSFYSDLRQTHSDQLEKIQIFVKTIIEDILNKSLVWRAGKSAGALRVAALNCLHTILGGNVLDTEVIESISPEICTGCIGLLDEQLFLNRLFSVKCLGKLATSFRKKRGYGAVDLVNKMYPELLKRMDDEEKQVRLAAAAALSELYASLPEQYSRELFKAHLEHAVGVLVVHLDDHDQEIQDAVFDTLTVVGSITPESVVSKCEDFKVKHRSPEYCNRLISRFSNATVTEL